MSDKMKSTWDRIPFLQKLKNIKHIEVIVISIFVVVLAIVYLSSINSGSTSSDNYSDATLEEYANYLESKLSNVIGQIDGAGKVSVMLTFDGRITYEYATENEEVTTSSSVTNGTNTKTTVNEKVIIVTQNGKSTPLIVKEIYPPISGVIVVSSGAESVGVRLNIISAVETVLGISPNKVQVLTGKS